MLKIVTLFTLLTLSSPSYGENSCRSLFPDSSSTESNILSNYEFLKSSQNYEFEYNPMSVWLDYYKNTFLPFSFEALFTQLSRELEYLAHEVISGKYNENLKSLRDKNEVRFVISKLHRRVQRLLKNKDVDYESLLRLSFKYNFLAHYLNSGEIYSDYYSGVNSVLEAKVTQTLGEIARFECFNCLLLPTFVTLEPQHQKLFHSFPVYMFQLYSSQHRNNYADVDRFNGIDLLMNAEIKMHRDKQDFFAEVYSNRSRTEKLQEQRRVRLVELGSEHNLPLYLQETKRKEQAERRAFLSGNMSYVYPGNINASDYYIGLQKGFALEIQNINLLPKIEEKTLFMSQLMAFTHNIKVSDLEIDNYVATLVAEFLIEFLYHKLPTDQFTVSPEGLIKGIKAIHQEEGVVQGLITSQTSEFYKLFYRYAKERLNAGHYEIRYLTFPNNNNVREIRLAEEQVLKRVRDIIENARQYNEIRRQLIEFAMEFRSNQELLNSALKPQTSQ